MVVGVTAICKQKANQAYMTLRLAFLQRNFTCRYDQMRFYTIFIV